MRFHLISDNKDTLIGMRLAGISGVMAKEPGEIEKALDAALEDEDIAVVLITEELVRMCRDYIYGVKLNCKKPLIVEIPGRNSDGRNKDSITKYIRDAIGIKI